MTIRILLADDHKIVRTGLRQYFEDEPELEIVGEAVDGKQALQQALDLKPDVVLMDLVMPGMDGIQATAAIRQELPETRVIALTSVLEDAAVVDAVRAGAVGYLLKNANADELIQAIKEAVSGQVHLAPEAAARLMRQVGLPKPPDALTERETQVLRLLAAGRSNKEIAHELDIGEGTVKSHVSKILAKLELPSRTQAALYAVRAGLVSAPPQKRVT